MKKENEQMNERNIIVTDFKIQKMKVNKSGILDCFALREGAGKIKENRMKQKCY